MVVSSLGLVYAASSSNPKGNGGNNTNNNNNPVRPWTLMVYMSDCNLEPLGIMNINEMEYYGSTTNLNIVVQFDRWNGIQSGELVSGDDESNGDWTTAKRFYITKDSNDKDDTIRSREVANLGEINCGDPQELVKFAQWTMTKYPADNYALILWDHGGGIDGVCYDEYPEDQLTVPEVGQALRTITSSGTNKIDVLGFCACLMSTVEVAHECSKYADYMVASEILITGKGWDYAFLEDMGADPAIQPRQVATRIVDTFMTFSEKYAFKYSNSLTVLDLTKMPAVDKALKDLSKASMDAGESESDNIQTARSESQPVMEGQASKGVDIYHLLINYKDITEDLTVKDSITKALDALYETNAYFKKFYPAKGFDISNLRGMSLYHPDFGAMFEEDASTYASLAFSADVGWDDLLTGYYEDTKPEQVLSFVNDSLWYDTYDLDRDGWNDTMSIAFNISSTKDLVDGYISIDVYDIRMEHVDSLYDTFVINSTEIVYLELGVINFSLTPEYGNASFYWMALYLCTGSEFKVENLQDYAETDFEWLEIYRG